MNIQEENLGIKKRGKKVVGTFDLYVPVKTRDHENKLGFGLIEYKLIIYYSGYLVVILSEQ